MPPGTAVSEPLEVRGLDWTTEGAARPEAHVVRQDQQNIGSPRWSLYCLRKAGPRIPYGATDTPLEVRLAAALRPVPLRSAENAANAHGDTPARNVDPSDLLRRLIPAWFREALVGAVLPSSLLILSSRGE